MTVEDEVVRMVSGDQSLVTVTATLARESILLSDAEVGFCLSAMRHFFPAPDAAYEMFGRAVVDLYLENALDDYLWEECEIRIELAHRHGFVTAGPYDSPARWAKGFLGAGIICDHPYMANLACLAATKHTPGWYDEGLKELVDHMRYSRCMAPGWLARDWGVA